MRKEGEKLGCTSRTFWGNSCKVFIFDYKYERKQKLKMRVKKEN